MLGSIRAQQDETGSCPKDIIKGEQSPKKRFKDKSLTFNPTQSPQNF